MRRNVAYLFFGVFLAVGLLAVPAQAELGLAGILAAQGSDAVAQTVIAAVEAVYADGLSAQDTIDRLAAIVNEVELLQNDAALSDAIVAVMSKGGPGKLAVGKKAVLKSNYGKNNPAAVEQMYTAVSAFVAANAAAPEVSATPGKQIKTAVTPVTTVDVTPNPSPATPI